MISVKRLGLLFQTGFQRPQVYFTVYFTVLYFDMSVDKSRLSLTAWPLPGLMSSVGKIVTGEQAT